MSAILRSATFKIYAATGLIIFATQVYAAEPAYQPAERGARQMNQGKKLETDAVLRQGMDNIRQAMAASQEGIGKESLGIQDYQQLAATVDKNIADIVKNCKLTRDADTAFHGIVLGDLTQSTELMRTSQKAQAQRVGALGVLQSLRNYGEYFQHPGWNVSAAKSR